MRKFTGPFEIIKLLGPVNVVLRKSAKSTPFTTHIDKLRKLPSDQIDSDRVTERAQEPEDGKMDVTAFVDVLPAASLKQCQSPEVVAGKKKTVESETGKWSTSGQ